MNLKRLFDMSETSASKLQKELEKLGITEEIFTAALILAPARQVTLGYPQRQVSVVSVQQNW
jgi:hypothetical protein